MASGAARKPSEKPTTAAVWKKASKPELVKLPSGNQALLRRPRSFAMMAKDEIPNPLLKIVMEATGTAAAPAEEERSPKEYVSYLFWIASRAFVEPRLHWSEDPEEKAPDGWLLPEDVDDTDLMYVVSWAQGLGEEAVDELLEDFAPFLAERAGDADGGDGEGVRPAAEHPARP